MCSALKRGAPILCFLVCPSHLSQYFSVILTYKNALISVEMCLYSLISFSVDVTFDRVFLANVFFLQNRDPKFSDKDSLDASALI